MTHHLHDERGSALIITLMATMLLTALGVALLLTSSTETLISANYRTSQETLYAADAAIERGIQDLMVVSNVTGVVNGTLKSSFMDNGAAVLPDGAKANLAELTANLQAESDATYGADPNRPIWQLYGHGNLSDLLPAGSIATPAYAVIWVADDPSETDGDPATDANGVVVVRAEAFGEHGARKSVEATVRRNSLQLSDTGYTGQRGMDEGGRNLRADAVGTPGAALTEMRMSREAGGMVVQ